MFYTLFASSVVQFDGAMGTQLQKRVENLDGCIEMVNITDSGTVSAIHADYVAAGARVVITNTLGANRIKLSKYGLADKVREINHAAVACAKSSGAEFVALSMGPVGEFLRPLGLLTFDELYSVFAEQAEAGKSAGVDLLLIETQTDLAQARIAAIAASEKTMLPIAVSMTYEANNRTLMGQTPECASVSVTPHIHALGINCSGGPEQMLIPLAKMRRVSPLPVITQPNAGIPRHEDGRTVFPYGPDEMAPMMSHLIEAGAAGIGGCCGTTPEHIAKMAVYSKQAPPVVPDFDGIDRICSAREAFALSEAVTGAQELDYATASGLIDALYDITPDDATAIIVKLNAFTPDEIASLLPEMLAATPMPLFFNAPDGDRLETALRHYPGCSAVKAPSSCSDIVRKYGAFEI